MATQAQIDANRRNAQRSTGPRTSEGKAASRWNSLRHGLAAEQPVLPHEDPAQYHRVRGELIETWQPANAQELMLVDQVARGWLRMNRAARFETALLDLQARGLKHTHAIDTLPTPDDDEAIAASFFEDETGNGFNRWCRYDARAQSTYYRALTHLRSLVNDRLRREDRLERTYATPAADSQVQAERPRRAVGFVRLPPMPSAAHSPAGIAAYHPHRSPEIGSVPPRPLSTQLTDPSSERCPPLIP
jgi:hypothetical protein